MNFCLKTIFYYTHFRALQCPKEESQAQTWTLNMSTSAVDGKLWGFFLSNKRVCVACRFLVTKSKSRAVPDTVHRFHRPAPGRSPPLAAPGLQLSSRPAWRYCCACSISPAAAVVREGPWGSLLKDKMICTEAQHTAAGLVRGRREAKFVLRWEAGGCENRRCFRSAVTCTGARTGWGVLEVALLSWSTINKHIGSRYVWMCNITTYILKYM